MATQVYIVMAPNFSEVPLFVSLLEKDAQEAGLKICEELNTNVEILSYWAAESKHTYLTNASGILRLIPKSEQKKLQESKEVLQKYFDPDDEDFQFLEHNLCVANFNLSSEDRKKLNEIGVIGIDKDQLNRDTISYLFYKTRTANEN